MPLSRRSVLALTGLAATVGAVGGVGAVGIRWWDRPAGQGFRFLAEEEAAFLRALAEAAWPPTTQIPVDGGSIGLDRFIDEAMGTLPDTQQKLVRLLFHALDSWTLPTRLSSFAGLDLEGRMQVLQGWNESQRPEIRQAASSLLLLLGMGYCTHPDVAPFFERWHRCGYGR